MKSSIIAKKYFKEGKLLAGFTIIELIISIFILSVVTVGIFSTFSIMTILTSDTADRLTATYLAQEGMEIVRNIRDTNWLNMVAGSPAGATWVDGLTVAGANNPINCDNSSNHGCQVDYTTTGAGSGSKLVKPFGSGSYLNIDLNGFYGYVTGGHPTTTKFKRKIIIVPVTDVDTKSDHIIKITVQVSWDAGANIFYPSRWAGECPAGASNCIEAKGTLYDWYNYVNQ